MPLDLTSNTQHRYLRTLRIPPIHLSVHIKAFALYSYLSSLLPFSIHFPSFAAQKSMSDKVRLIISSKDVNV